MPEFVIVGIFVSLLCSFCILPLLRKLKAGQPVLSYVNEHKGKSGTPTMGGLVFIIPLLIALIFIKPHSLAFVSVIIIIAYGIIGFLDDFIKIKFKHNEGLKPWQKIISQIVVSLAVSFYCYNNEFIGSDVYIPFFNTVIDFGKWSVLLYVFIFIAATNSVNLTDGLDGLAGSVTTVYFVFLILFIYIKHTYFVSLGSVLITKEYDYILSVMYLLTGSLIAFLIFNAFPARMFMGDTGSMALGAAVATFSVFTGFSFFILILGVTYVISSISVILQVLYYKATKKRIFLMAPFHHHLQMKGLSEVRISVIYIAVTVVAGILLLCYGIDFQGGLA